MLKGHLKLARDEIVDPNKSVAEAVLEAARVTNASNKDLITAIKGIIMAPPQVVHHETKQMLAAAPVQVARPTKWVFTVQRDDAGFMTSITAEAK